MPIMIEEPPPNVAGMPGFPPSAQLPAQQVPEVASATGSASDSGSGSWLGGWFSGGEKKEPQGSSSGSETKILESFDAPPVPNFEYK